MLSRYRFSCFFLKFAFTFCHLFLSFSCPYRCWLLVVIGLDEFIEPLSLPHSMVQNNQKHKHTKKSNQSTRYYLLNGFCGVSLNRTVPGSLVAPTTQPVCGVGVRIYE